MKNINWREIVEILGIVSIVASLLLVATEVRQANRIAVADAARQIHADRNQLLLERATNPEFAKLYAKLEDPDSHLITATEVQQIRGIAKFFINHALAVQAAHDQGFMTEAQLAADAAAFARMLDELPGLRNELLTIYAGMSAHTELGLLAALAESPSAEPAANQ